MAIPTNSALPINNLAATHVASSAWSTVRPYGLGRLVRLLLFRLLRFVYSIGLSNPVSSTNKYLDFKLRFAHGWVVNLLSLQPSGMCIQRKDKEQYSSRVAQQGLVNKIVEPFDRSQN